MLGKVKFQENANILDSNCRPVEIFIIVDRAAFLHFTTRYQIGNTINILSRDTNLTMAGPHQI